MAEQHPTQDSSEIKIEEEPYHLLQLENVYYTPPPASLPQYPLPLNREKAPTNLLFLNDRDKDGAPNFNKVDYRSNIKNVIGNLINLPTVNMEMLACLNVVDQYYFGTSMYDNGVWLSVAFTRNVKSAFREVFIDITKTSKYFKAIVY